MDEVNIQIIAKSDIPKELDLRGRHLGFWLNQVLQLKEEEAIKITLNSRAAVQRLQANILGCFRYARQKGKVTTRIAEMDGHWCLFVVRLNREQPEQVYQNHKGKWCWINRRKFCQEENGCLNCQIYLETR